MRFRPLLCVMLLARLAAAQASDTTRRPPGVPVSGIVHDSIARRPLGGAIVQLVAADSLTRAIGTTVSDSLGRFTLADVPAGRYMLGFFHPMLDSLGLEPTVREVRVDGRGPVHADLAIPSAARLRAAICGAPSGPDLAAVVVGVVRDARTRAPDAGATVTVEWLEISFSVPEGIGRHIEHLVATTAENGWFAMCNVPTAGTMWLMANRGADSTGLIDVHIPAEGFLRRELYLGSTPVGDERLSGVVVAAVGGKPLGESQVGIVDGPQTRANDRGEWTLVGAPVGTRMLEVRAVGYYPERRAVDVVAGAPPILTELSTMKAVLDTVRITATRLDPKLRGFEERRRGGLGHYVTPEDVARRNPIVTSDLFHTIPGMYVERSPHSANGNQIMMRGMFDARCAPAIYLDGQYMSILTADDIDSWVAPDEIAGLEVYSAGMAPAQFQVGLGNCGSIVIWSRLRPRSAPPVSWKVRAAMVLGLSALGFALGAILFRR